MWINQEKLRGVIVYQVERVIQPVIVPHLPLEDLVLQHKIMTVNYFFHTDTSTVD